MNRLIAVLTLVLLMATLAPAANGQAMEEIVITDVWARPTVSGMTMDDAMDMGEEGEMDMDGMGDMAMDMAGTSAVYMTITNPGDRGVSLIAGATDAAGIVEIHETTLDENDVMAMRPVEGGIVIPAGEQVNLQPGGLHVMLLEPEALAPGDALALNLTFEMLDDDDAPTGETLDVVVGAAVQDTPPEPAPYIVNAGSVWARPTVAGETMDDAMEMGTEGQMDEDMAASDEMAMQGMGMAGTSAVYMTITNPTDADDALVAASTDAAGIVEIHETTLNENDVMAMRPAEGGIPVPAGETAVLQPGGFHVMLLEPMAMAPGDAILVTLEFESGAQVTVAAPVEDRLMSGMMME